jgi:multiple sugar transport system substrate-binding protein
MFKKCFAALLLVSLVSFSLAGTYAAAQSEPIVITWWNGFTGPDRPAVEALVEQFNSSQDRIRVDMTITPWDSLMQTLLSSMSAGEGPDLIGVNFAHIPRFAEAGVIADLSAAWQEGGELDPANFPESLVNLMQYDGKFYAAPVNFATLMLYYNKDMFAAAGLDPETPPATLDEWVEAIRTLTRDGQYGIALGERQTIPNWPILLWMNGGDVVSEGESALASPETLEALNLWGGLVRDEGVSPIGLTGAEADQLFMSQRAAMGVTGPWMVNGFTEAGINFDVAPLPVGPGGPVTLADSVVFMVGSSSDEAHQAAAIEFIEFWNSRESQLYWSQQTGFPPARLDLSDDPELFEANEWAAKFASVVPDSRFYLPGETNFTQIDNDIFIPMVQTITQGVASVEDAARAADEQLSALLAQ